MSADNRLDGAILAAYFVPVVGNMLYKPILGMQQTLLFVAGLALAMKGAPGLDASGWVLMAGAWIWSLVTLESAYHARRRQRET